MGNYYGNFVRSIRGTDNPSPFMGAIKGLSFACWQMKEAMGTNLQRLSLTIPEGVVTVMRVGDVEYVTVEPVLGGAEIDLLKVELISSGSSYTGLYRIYKDKIKKLSNLRLFTHRYKVFGSYFSFRPNLPDADITEESCVCVVPSAPTNLVANMAADNVFGTAVNHKDDWHYINFKWIGFPYWWITSDFAISEYEDAMSHPGLTAGVWDRYVHWSFSLTYGAIWFDHILRHIDQEKRLYRPGEIDLPHDDGSKNEDGTPKYHMERTGKIVTIVDDIPITTYKMSPYGKKPFTRDSDKKLVSYNERMAIGSGASYTINDPKYNMVMFFWPFIPYMWEIPCFNIFGFSNNDALYGRCSYPENGSAYIRGWHFECDLVGGESVDIAKHADTATFIGSDPVLMSSIAERPHVHYVGGYPTLVGSENGTWVDTFINNWGYSANIEKTVPIGTVCNLNDLFIKNTFAITGVYSGNNVEIHTKATSFGASIYFFYPSYPEMWQLGGKSDTSTSTQRTTNSFNVSIAVNSILGFGDIVIDSGSGSMTYRNEYTKNIEVTNTFAIDVYYADITGSRWRVSAENGIRTDSKIITGDSTRNLVLFAVLDYDSESNFILDRKICSAVAVVYKRITIVNAINRRRTVNSFFDTGGSPLNGLISWGAGAFNAWPREPSDGTNPQLPPDERTITDTCTPTGTRKVEYILYANVGGKVYTKTLATFNGGMGTGSGQRVYGVVCKLDQAELLITYDLEDFVTPAGTQGVYDSPLNFEDWNRNGEIEMWSLSKRIVGIVNLSTTKNFGVELFDEQTPIPNEVYSVSARMVQRVVK